MLNYEKRNISRDKLRFYGHMFSGEGMKPDPDKVRAINKLNEPINIGEFRSFLGMAGYCAHYLERYTITAELLQRLLRKDKPFRWSGDC